MHVLFSRRPRHICCFASCFVDVRFLLEQLVADESTDALCLVCLADILHRRGEFVIAYAPPAVEAPLSAPPCVGLVGVGEE